MPATGLGARAGSVVATFESAYFDLERDLNQPRLCVSVNVEDFVAGLEAELGQIGYRLENPPTDPVKVAQLGKEYQRVQQEMDVWLAEWEQLQA